MKKYSTEEQRRRAKINKRKKILMAPITFIEKVCSKIRVFYRDKIKYPIIWFFQRGIRGYCDRDTWDFERWFFNIAPKIIRDIEKHHNGVLINGPYKPPISFNKEFLEMAECFEKANSTESMFNYTPEYQIYLKYKNRGFELFNKYFDYLGW